MQATADDMVLVTKYYLRCLTWRTTVCGSVLCLRKKYQNAPYILQV